MVLTIVDTAGQEEYRTMRDHAMKSGDAYLLVYAIDDRNFVRRGQALVPGHPPCQDGSPITPPVVLAGNKVDLAAERKVTFVEARRRPAHFQVPVPGDECEGRDERPQGILRGRPRPGGTNATKPPALRGEQQEETYFEEHMCRGLSNDVR